MPKRPEKIAPGVYRVDGLPFARAVSVFLLADSDGWTLVDTALASSVPRIQGALTALGGDAATHSATRRSSRKRSACY